MTDWSISALMPSLSHASGNWYEYHAIQMLRWIESSRSATFLSQIWL
jgi:hypothetical protein